jgi:hypothetical protein
VPKNEKAVCKKKAWAGESPANSLPELEAALKSNVCCALLGIDRHLHIMLFCPFITTGKGIRFYEIEASG